jgi:hypothetical protein
VVRSPHRELFVAAVLAFLLGLGMFTLVDLPLNPGAVAQARAMFPSRASPSRLLDLAQAFIPLRLLLIIGALSTLTAVLWRTHFRWSAMLVGALIIALLVPFIVRNFAEPMRAYEAADDEALLDLLHLIDCGHELVIASDLADAAESYRRPLVGVALTAYAGDQFYVSNLSYGHKFHADAPMRLESLRAFFGSPWSDGHRVWLAQTGVTHVLVSNRCVPPWWGQPEVSLNVVGHTGKWTLFEAREYQEADTVALPRWEILTPAFGRAPCL